MRVAGARLRAVRARHTAEARLRDRASALLVAGAARLGARAPARELVVHAVDRAGERVAAPRREERRGAGLATAGGGDDAALVEECVETWEGDARSGARGECLSSPLWVAAFR